MRLTDTNLLTKYTLDNLYNIMSPRFDAHISKIYQYTDPFDEQNRLTQKYLNELIEYCLRFVVNNRFYYKDHFEHFSASTLFEGISHYSLFGELYVSDDEIAYINSAFETHPDFAKYVFDFFDGMFLKIEADDAKGDDLREYGTLGKNAEYIERLRKDTLSLLKGTPKYERFAMEYGDEELENEVKDILEYVFTTRMPNFRMHGFGKMILIAEVIPFVFTADGLTYEKIAIKHSIANHCIVKKYGTQFLVDGIADSDGVDSFHKDHRHIYLTKAAIDVLKCESMENINQYKRNARKNINTHKVV